MSDSNKHLGEQEAAGKAAGLRKLITKWVQRDKFILTVMYWKYQQLEMLGKGESRWSLGWKIGALAKTGLLPLNTLAEGWIVYSVDSCWFSFSGGSKYKKVWGRDPVLKADGLMKIYIPSAEQPEYWLPGGFLSTDTEWLQTKGLQILTSRDSSTNGSMYTCVMNCQ